MYSLNKRNRDEDEEELSDLRNEHKVRSHLLLLYHLSKLTST